jgi:hypothetical protein
MLALSKVPGFGQEHIVLALLMKYLLSKEFV